MRCASVTREITSKKVGLQEVGLLLHSREELLRSEQDKWKITCTVMMRACFSKTTSRDHDDDDEEEKLYQAINLGMLERVKSLVKQHPYLLR